MTASIPKEKGLKQEWLLAFQKNRKIWNKKDC